MSGLFPSAPDVILEGDVVRVTFESDETGFRVLRVRISETEDPVTVVGVLPRVAAGARVRVTGSRATDPRHGEQIRASGITVIAPKTLEGLERYLGSGLVPGVGRSIAKRIVDAFGEATLRVLDEEPERLLTVEGLGKKRAQAIVKAWLDRRALHDVMVFLQAHGASPALAARIFRRYGDRAAQIISDEPYRLALEVWGVGFRTADRIAASLGTGADSPLRHQAGVLQALRDETERGHVYTEEERLVARSIELLGEGTREDDLLRAVEALEHSRHMVIERAGPGTGTGTGRNVYAREMREAEVRVAASLTRLVLAESAPIQGAARAMAAFEKATGLPLSEEQRQAVLAAARERVLVITGGPGVGKTTLVRAILSLYQEAGLSVRLAAPTGRAAKRMSESSGREATTLHRLLEFEPKGGGFKRHEGAPLEGRAFVVDETSMVDLRLADSLLRAIPPGARLLFVGDVDQLPSVGPGAFLADVIESGIVPTLRLTHIFRQASQSLIVVNAHRINRGEMPLVPKAGGASSDFFIASPRTPEATQKLLLDLVTSRIPGRFGLHPLDDIQVLTPMNRGPSGTYALNALLQEALNPKGPGLKRGRYEFRVGDKVMQLKNDYERQVYNGDVGRVLGVNLEEASLTVGFDDREVPYDSANVDELSLAYACTIHKSQGSEYPAVVMPLATSHFIMLSKNLVYTGVTRGKRLVILLAEPRALELALSVQRREERRSLLGHRIKAEAERGR